jgi:hypothetical protein
LLLACPGLPNIIGAVQCPQCKNNDVPPCAVDCPFCEFRLGFPNVREAERKEEVEALDQRYQEAHQAARSRGAEATLVRFEDAVKASRAVMCRHWGTLTKMVETGNTIFRTFYENVKEGSRLPKDSELERARAGVDATFFPYYHERVHFAALSLDGRGPVSYGECHLVLRDGAVSHRASVFEENTLVFCRKVIVPVGQRPPPGFRATWTDRHRLAAAKLHAEIDPATDDGRFPGILLKQGGATDKDEFIEAHVYGKLDARSVERLIAPKPKVEEDRVLAGRFKRKLVEAGAKVEMV